MGLRSIRDLLEYPVTVVGVLGLWSFKSGGTVGCARRKKEREEGETQMESRGKAQRVDGRHRCRVATGKRRMRVRDSERRKH